MSLQVNSKSKCMSPLSRGCTVAVATLVALGVTRLSIAAAISWDNSAGDGLAATAANWTPALIPSSADDLTFSIAGAYPVTWGAAVSSSRTHVYRNGTVTNTMSSPHTVSTGITVAPSAGEVATMTLTTGTLTSNGSMIVGDSGTGTLNVNDSDAALIIAGATSDLIIGNNGDAAMSITGRGQVQVADQFIAGSNSASSPTITVSGSLATPPFGSSFLQVLGTGQSRIGAGGDATMTISSGAIADFAGDLVIANGSASNSSVTVQTAVLLNARLQVDGDLLVGRNISAGIAAGTGTLNINAGGATIVGGDTFLGDPDGGTGLIQMNGGLFSGTGAINVLAGSTISGTGTINPAINNAGNIQPTGVNGLTLAGILTNTTNLVTGTKIHFSGTGGYTGSGTCNAAITGDANALITATGTLSIGTNSSAGYSYNGRLAVGGSIVTLVDTNGAVLGGLTTINSGRLECSAGIGLANGGTIQGDGLFVGNIINSGVMDPHTANANSGGLFTVQGDLSMNPTGKVDMDIKGTPASNAYDRINVTGEANFGGTLRVKLPTGFVPKVGQQFIAVNAIQGRNGEFVAMEPPVPSPCNNVTFVLVYSSTAAIVLVRPPLGCTALGDLNSDGSCNGPDIQMFTDAITGGVYVPCADLNGDCQNTIDDVAIFLNCLT